MLNISNKIGVYDNTVIYTAMDLQHKTGCKIIGDTLKIFAFPRHCSKNSVQPTQEQNEIINENKKFFISIKMNK